MVVAHEALDQCLPRVADRHVFQHASKYGSEASVAEEVPRHAAASGTTVTVHHIRDLDPTTVPIADLYELSSPAAGADPWLPCAGSSGA